MFFPNPAFGWFFLLALVAFCGVAAYTDLRWVIIPKWLSIPMLVVGLLANLVRGAFLNGSEGAGFFLTTDSSFLGCVDGFLFGLVGFLVAFVLFFLLYLLGGCRGGDVKLFAATGAWVGPIHVIVLLVVGNLFVFAFSVIAILIKLISGKKLRLKSRPKDFEQPSSRLLAYSLSLFLAVVSSVFWLYRFDLGLAERSLSAHYRTGQVRL